MITCKKEISGVQIELKCSALTPRIYRAQFNRDMITDMNIIFKVKDGMTAEIGECVENILYTMAKQANPDLCSMDEFLDSFNSPAWSYQAVPVLMDVWNSAMEMTSTADSKKKKPRAKTQAQSSCSDAQN